MPDAPEMAIGCVLGFDVGAKRIGVAVGNALSGTARDLSVLDVRGGQPDWPAVQRLLAEWRPDALLVGDPRTLDGGDQPARRRARRFADSLRQRFALPVHLVDERSSSVEAARRFAAGRAAGTRRRGDADRLDALAAAVIVERWLAAPTDPIPSSTDPDASPR
ncbi:Holliday junction resolvase RuvX [Rehaibacterium terrae]